MRAGLQRSRDQPESARALWLREWWYRPIMLTCIGFIVILFPLGCARLIPFNPYWMLGSLAAMVACDVTRYYSRRDLVRQVREFEFRICLNCGYVMVDRRDGDRCPECNAIYNSGDAVRIWKKALRIK